MSKSRMKGVAMLFGIELGEIFYIRNAKCVIYDDFKFTVISFVGMEWATIRFIGMAIINAISTTLWICVMQNAINDVVKGKELTIWQSLAKSYEMYASLAGGLVILLIGDMHIELAIGMQCMANLFMGLTDLRARKLLMRSDDSDNR